MRASQSDPVSVEKAEEEVEDSDGKSEIKDEKRDSKQAEEKRDSLVDEALVSKDARRQYQDDSKLRTSCDSNELTFDSREIARQSKQTMASPQAHTSYTASKSQELRQQ